MFGKHLYAPTVVRLWVDDDDDDDLSSGDSLAIHTLRDFISNVHCQYLSKMISFDTHILWGHDSQISFPFYLYEIHWQYTHCGEFISNVYS